MYITQDYAKGIQMERKVLIKAMFLARKKGMNAKVVDGNLVVNNNVYNVDNIPDNLKESSTLNSNSSRTIFQRFISYTYRTQTNSPALLNFPQMFSLSWHRTSSKPNVNFRLFLFCLTCISFLLGVNCFAAFLSSYPFCLLSPLHNHHFTLNDELVICSLNVRGLSNSLKRRETFCWLKMKKMEFFSSRGLLY